RAMDAQPDVAALRQRRLAAVQPHAHAQLGAIWPGMCGERALAGDRRLERVVSAAEDGEEGVPLSVDHFAAVRGERIAKDPAVLAEHVSVMASELLEQPSRAFDVREQEGDRAARKLR